MAGKQLKIILVHGLGHGAWCWYKVATSLRSDGHSVLTLDLAAAGTNKYRMAEDVLTFADYSQPLMEAIAELSEGQKAVLIGHSFGGQTLALAMDTFPHKIAVAIFVTAFMPDTVSPPSSVFDKLGEYFPDAAAWMDVEFKEVRVSEREQPFHTMLVGPQFMREKLYQLCAPEQLQELFNRKIEFEIKPVVIPGRSEPFFTFCFNSNVLATYFYQNCSFEDLTLASMMVRPASTFSEDLSNCSPFTKEGFGSVDKIYIICNEDARISEDYVRWMIQNNGNVKETIEIKGADHMPMLSKPRELCQLLASIVDKYSIL